MAINNTINKSILTLITKGQPFTTKYDDGVYIGLLTKLPTDADCMSGSNKDWIEVPSSIRINEVTKLPVASSEPGVDVSTGYGRYKLSYTTGTAPNKTYYYSSGAHGRSVISSPPQWDETNKACIIANDGDDMMFPNIVETLHSSINWGVIGFGLFSAATSPSENDTTMIAYGKLVDAEGQPIQEPVKLKAGSVPIFYQNSFKLMLGDGDTPVAGGGN